MLFIFNLTRLGFFLLLPYFVTPESSSIYEYGPKKFKSQVEKLDGNFIMFYAPWCRHCTDFQPIWEELAEMVNTEGSMFAIAQVDCTSNQKLCNDVDITGYPTLLYFYKNNFKPVEYKGTRDLPSLTLFLSEVFNMKTEDESVKKSSDEVKIYSGMAYLTDLNFEKFISKGQHFVMFYAPWCKASQKFAVTWAALAVEYAHNNSLQIGKVNCMDHKTTCLNFDVKEYPRQLWILDGRVVSGTTELKSLQELKEFVEQMAEPGNHNPDRYTKKVKVEPVLRLNEDNFHTYIKKDIVFVNYFAPWCAHCMQLIQTVLQLGDRYQNDSRIIIADVDCSQSEKLCDNEKVNHFPTLVLYKDSKVIYHEKGTDTLENIVELLEDTIRNKSPVTENEEEIQVKDEL